VQIDAPRPVGVSKETWTGVASVGEQLQQLSQLLVCNGSENKDKLIG
jgi:hypothetical protein